MRVYVAAVLAAALCWVLGAAMRERAYKKQAWVDINVASGDTVYEYRGLLVARSPWMEEDHPLPTQDSYVVGLLH